MIDKPFSAASERNREPILAVLRERFAAAHWVLEIGSGTGQHAVHFAAALPHLVWQTSERAENLPGLRLWLADAELRRADPQRGLRDIEAVDQLARSAGLDLLDAREMPANNSCVTWQRRAGSSNRSELVANAE